MARTPHLRYVRHRRYDRLRHSTRFKAFLAEQADRLGVTPEDVFELMKAGATAEQITQLPAAAAPVNTALPTVTGTPQVGQVLTCTPGTWTGNPTPTFTYQWQRGTTNIAGATNATYTAVAADAGQTLRCVVTASNTKGSASANSADTAAVTQAPANTAPPAITGTPTEGEVLTVSNGTWTGSPTPTYTRQWERNGTDIAGATAATYTLVTADVGTTITCTVTATNSAGNASATSAGVGPIAAA